MGWRGQPIGTHTVLTKSRSGGVAVYSNTGQASISALLGFGDSGRLADCKNSLRQIVFFVDRVVCPCIMVVLAKRGGLLPGSRDRVLEKASGGLDES